MIAFAQAQRDSISNKMEGDASSGGSPLSASHAHKVYSGGLGRVNEDTLVILEVVQRPYQASQDRRHHN